MQPAMSNRFVCVMPVTHVERGFAEIGMCLASLAMRLSCAFAHVWQALSALSLELGDHPGGYQYLHFRLRALMCGNLRGVVAETAAGSRSVASRDACTMQKKLELRPGSVHVVCRVWLCCGHF